MAHDKKLLGYISEIEHLNEEIADLKEGIKGLKESIKDSGYNVKAVMEVIKRRTKNRSSVDEMDELIVKYETDIVPQGELFEEKVIKLHG